MTLNVVWGKIINYDFLLPDLQQEYFKMYLINFT